MSKMMVWSVVVRENGTSAQARFIYFDRQYWQVTRLELVRPLLALPAEYNAIDALTMLK